MSAAPRLPAAAASAVLLAIEGVWVASGNCLGAILRGEPVHARIDRSNKDCNRFAASLKRFRSGLPTSVIARLDRAIQYPRSVATGSPPARGPPRQRGRA